MRLTWLGFVIATIFLFIATLLLLWSHLIAVPLWLGSWGWHWINWASTPVGFVSSVALPTLILSVLQTRWILSGARA